jgi:hypothetical protein
MLEELQRRNYSQTTVTAYLKTVEDFAKHFNKSPDQLGADEIRSYQVHLLKEKSLEHDEVHQQEFFEAVHFGLSAALATAAAGVRLHARVGGFSARQAEAEIFFLFAAVFFFAHDGPELGDSGACGVGLFSHWGLPFLSCWTEGPESEGGQGRRWRRAIHP